MKTHTSHAYGHTLELDYGGHIVRVRLARIHFELHFKNPNEANRFWSTLDSVDLSPDLLLALYPGAPGVRRVSMRSYRT